MLKCGGCGKEWKPEELILHGLFSPYLVCPVCEEKLADVMDAAVTTFTMYVKEAESWVVCTKTEKPRRA